jgi:hypothetical protein
MDSQNKTAKEQHIPGNGGLPLDLARPETLATATFAAG